MLKNRNIAVHCAVAIAALCLTAGVASVGIERAGATSLGGKQISASLERYVDDLGELFAGMTDGQMF